MDDTDMSEEYRAFFAPRTHRFETISTRVPASLANLHTYFPATEAEYTRRARGAAVLGVAVGVVVGVIGFLVDQLTRGVYRGVYEATAAVMARAGGWAVVVFAALCSLIVAAAAALVVFVAPLGAGSGIPELKSYLNGVRVPGFLRLNTLWVKALGVVFSIAGGMICGKQGPMIHVGAIVGAGMSQGASATLSWRLEKPFKRAFAFLRTEAWKRDFAAVGAACGVAVAFGAPMGAWMWVYEEACTHWSWALGIITLGACLAGTFTIRVLNHLAMGSPNGGFVNFTLTQFGKLVTPTSTMTFPFKDLPWYVVVGVCGGIAGAVLPAVNKHITLFRYKSVTRRPWRIFEAALVALLTAVIRFGVPFLVNDCRPRGAGFSESISPAPFGDFSQFNCPDGQYSGWAAVFYNPTDTVVRAFLFAADKDALPVAAVAASVVYYYFFIVWTYGTAVPAGVFFPAFVVGGVYGRLLGLAMLAVFPSRTDVSLTGYAFLGAVSALAGVTRTISVAVVALEATGGNNAIFAAVVVALIAKLVADFLYGAGIYDLHIDLKGIPYLAGAVPHIDKYNKVRVSDLMASKVIAVRRFARISGLLHMLGTNSHNAFPVFLKVVPGAAPELPNPDFFDDKVDNAEFRTSSNTQHPNRIVIEGFKVGSGNGSCSGSGSGSGSGGADINNSTLNGCEEDVGVQGVATGDRAHTGRAVIDVNDGFVAVDESTIIRSMPRVESVSIITPTQHGMQATTFEGARTRVVNLTASGQVQEIAHAEWRTTMSPSPPMAGYSAAPTLIPNFELIGMIDRGTILALLENAVRLHEPDMGHLSEDTLKVLARDRLDAAWPNASRSKLETELISRFKDLNVDEMVIDLKPYIDPDPLLMSDQALAFAPYRLFRSTGARHILIANMRSGRVAGVLTRSDILPGRISEALEKLRSTKVE